QAGQAGDGHIAVLVGAGAKGTVTVLLVFQVGEAAFDGPLGLGRDHPFEAWPSGRRSSSSAEKAKALLLNPRIPRALRDRKRRRLTMLSLLCDGSFRRSPSSIAR